MKILDIVLILLIALAIGFAIARVKKNGGGCGGDCSQCTACKSCKKRDKV